jgi:hypothetical protein
MADWGPRTLSASQDGLTVEHNNLRGNYLWQKSYRLLFAKFINIVEHVALLDCSWRAENNELLSKLQINGSHYRLVWRSTTIPCDAPGSQVLKPEENTISIAVAYGTSRISSEWYMYVELLSHSGMNLGSLIPFFIFFIFQFPVEMHVRPISLKSRSRALGSCLFRNFIRTL